MRPVAQRRTRWGAAPSVSALLICLAACLRAHGGIVGSAHDFSSKPWSRGEPCAACHTPHEGNAAASRAPIWNRAFSTASYVLYSSSTMEATPSQPAHYGSRLCLSCHDGTVALDSFGGERGSSYISGRARVGTDLRAMHPIGIIYDAALAAADPRLHNPDARTMASGESVTKALLYGTGNLECGSCHDVHNERGFPKLLRTSNERSALCLTCHNM
ncbi:MAG: cytochrome c3 family protein [Planctomycetes bacterium]|nr:cytochrome c3 family protein [Planctomycetota bacterium]